MDARANVLGRSIVRFWSRTDVLITAWTLSINDPQSLPTPTEFIKTSARIRHLARGGRVEVPKVCLDDAHLLRLDLLGGVGPHAQFRQVLAREGLVRRVNLDSDAQARYDNELIVHFYVGPNVGVRHIFVREGHGLMRGDEVEWKQLR